jgi:hypothetical protein
VDLVHLRLRRGGGRRGGRHRRVPSHEERMKPRGRGGEDEGAGTHVEVGTVEREEL